LLQTDRQDNPTIVACHIKYTLLFSYLIIYSVSISYRSWDRNLFIINIHKKKLFFLDKRYFIYLLIIIYFFTFIQPKKNKNMEEKIENISILNVVCFILFGLSNILNKIMLFHIAFVGVLISLSFSIWILYKTIHFKNKDEKRLFIRSINSLIFCLFFSICYLLTIVHK
jgi:hypothetical protein